MKTILFIAALTVNASMHPGWNKIDGQNTWEYIFKVEVPPGFKEIRGEMHEFRSLFLTSETWEWYLKGTMSDSLFQGMLTGPLGFKKSSVNKVDHLKKNRQKEPEWFVKELKDSLDFYQSADGEFMIWHKPSSKTVWMTDYGIQ